MNHIQAMFDPSFAVSKSDLVNDCTLIIECIQTRRQKKLNVSLSLKNHLPLFRCVFPKSGEKMSCKKWHEYLKSKSPHIREKYLNFVGRNQVLYFNPCGVLDVPFIEGTKV